MSVVTLTDAVVGHPGAWQLGPIDLSVERGSFWGIVGPNGAGKSTLLRSIAGLMPLVAGGCTLGQGAERRGGMAYVPQREALDPVFPVTAMNVVMMGLIPRLGPGRPFGLSHRRQALAALDRVELRHLGQAPFRRLSGGEQQRVLLARASVANAALALLDEPTAAMDVDAERRVLDLVEDMTRSDGMAVLMVSHGLQAVRLHARRVILLDRERNQVFIGSPSEILGSVAQECEEPTMESVRLRAEGSSYGEGGEARPEGEVNLGGDGHRPEETGRAKDPASGEPGRAKELALEETGRATDPASGEPGRAKDPASGELGRAKDPPRGEPGRAKDPAPEEPA